MGYYIDADGNYPRHAGDVQIAQPGWLEGVDALPEGWVEVAPGIVPDGPFVEIAPIEIDGVMTRQFETIKTQL